MTQAAKDILLKSFWSGVVFVAFFSARDVMASSTAEVGHHGGIPSVVLWQAINFSLFVGLLFFLLRKAVKEHFLGRREGFLDAVSRAAAVKEKAEEEHKEIRQRLDRLHSEAEQNAQRAHSEAEGLKKEILREADVQAQHIKLEALRMVEIEQDKALSTVRSEIIRQSMEKARKILDEKIQVEDHNRLQNEFVDKIQAVPR